MYNTERIVKTFEYRGDELELSFIPQDREEDDEFIFIHVELNTACAAIGFSIDVYADYARGHHTDDDICEYIVNSRWTDEPVDNSVIDLMLASMSDAERIQFEKLRATMCAMNFPLRDDQGEWRLGEYTNRSKYIWQRSPSGSHIDIDAELAGKIMDKFERAMAKWHANRSVESA
jgi:hypothetical protein